MHRKKLLDLLERYDPTDEAEIYNKQQCLNLLKEHSDCFKRELRVGHFVGSCWLENYDGTKFLLTKHKKLKMWLQPGGHADGDPDIMKVSIREAMEESGLKSIEPVSCEIFDVDYHPFPEYKGIPAHYHYDIRFLLRAYDKNEKIQISNESDDLGWFDTPPNDNIGINRMFRKWKVLK